MSNEHLSIQDLKKRLDDLESRLSAAGSAQKTGDVGHAETRATDPDRPFTAAQAESGPTGARRSGEGGEEPFALSNEEIKRRLAHLEKQFESVTASTTAAEVVKLPFVPEVGEELDVRIEGKIETCEVLAVDRSARRAIIKIGARRYNVSFDRFVDAGDAVKEDDTGDDTRRTKRRTSTRRRKRDDGRDRTRNSANRLVRGGLHATVEALGAVGDAFTGFADSILDRNRGDKGESADRLNRRLPGDIASGFADAVEDLFDIPSKAADRFNERYNDRD